MSTASKVVARTDTHTHTYTHTHDGNITSTAYAGGNKTKQQNKILPHMHYELKLFYIMYITCSYHQIYCSQLARIFIIIYNHR